MKQWFILFITYSYQMPAKLIEFSRRQNESRLFIIDPQSDWLLWQNCLYGVHSNTPQLLKWIQLKYIKLGEREGEVRQAGRQSDRKTLYCPPSPWQYCFRSLMSINLIQLKLQWVCVRERGWIMDLWVSAMQQFTSAQQKPIFKTENCHKNPSLFTWPE